MDPLKIKDERQKKFARSDKRQDHGTRSNSDRHVGDDEDWVESSIRRRDYRAITQPEADQPTFEE